jgi:uncharacterized protein (TIGR04255 family)
VKPVRPKFTNPPLVERAITVVFQKLDKFTLGDFGRLWSAALESFPVSEAVAAVAPDIEQYDGFKVIQPTIELVQPNALPRAYFRNPEAGELVQVQPDRFTFNWLKTGPDHSYPHSEATLERFSTLFRDFESFVRERDLGAIDIIQCELTNVNAIPVSDVGESFADIATVLKMPDWRTDTDSVCLEGQIIGSRHLMLNEAGEPFGRVHAIGQPALRVTDDELTYRLDIMARGAPLGEGLEGARAFFEEAVSAINSVFLAITTRAGRRFWGEYDGDSV